MPMYLLCVGHLWCNRPTGPQRRYCMRAVLCHLLSHKSDQRPPASPPQSRSDKEALGAQRFHPRLHAWSFGTSQSRYYHPLLPSLGKGRQDHQRWLVFHLHWWRLVYCSGGEWMTFRPGWRWTAGHPCSRWILVCFHWGLVGSCPVASQRLQWLESWFRSASVGDVDH